MTPLFSDEKVLQLLREGKAVAEICNLTSWPRRNVTRLAARNGFLIDIVMDIATRPDDGPDDVVDVLATPPRPHVPSVAAARPAPPVRSAIEISLERGEASDKTRIRTAAATARKALDRLAELLREERERERQRQEAKEARERQRQEEELAREELRHAREKVRALREAKKRNLTPAGRARMQEVGRTVGAANLAKARAAKATKQKAPDAAGASRASGGGLDENA